MSLYAQEFPNNIRTVSGLVNAIKQDDVTLECNTLVGPVGIQLMDIPANYWSTQWKLYIVDKNNNASVNNITVTCPAGVLVNGSSSFTINANGASLLIRIASNANFVAQYSVTAGGGGVTNGANVGIGLGQVFKNLVGTILNFKTIKAGANITITNGLDEVTIDASGGSATQYLYAKKKLDNSAIIYFPINLAPTYSVVSGTVAQAYDSKVESGVTGFDLVSGIWTVPASGKYSISAKLITRLLAADVNSIVDSVGLGWQDVGSQIGTFAIGVVRLYGGGNTDVVASNKQPSLLERSNSDINIDCATLIVDLTIGDSVFVNVLNKTINVVKGIAITPGLPECFMDLSIIKVA
jgi:hypothetical protein